MIELIHLDLNITRHCNTRCSACSHASPFADVYYMTPERMADDLERIKPFAHFERLQLVGGEPTLHPQIVTLFEVARQSGVGDKVALITNGRLLNKMSDAFWSSFHVLKLSVYANLNPKAIELCRNRQERHGFELEITNFDEFYLQFSEHETDGVESFSNCVWKNDCYTLHEGYFYRCPQSAFFPKLFQGLPETIDGLALEGLTEQKLNDFIHGETPLNACRKCCGGHGKSIKWQESKTKVEWIRESTL